MVLMNDYRNFPFAVIHVIIADFDRNALVAVSFIAYVLRILMGGDIIFFGLLFFCLFYFPIDMVLL